MSKQKPSREKLDMATPYGVGDIEYGLYYEHYTGVIYEFDGVPTELREEDWRSTLSPHRSLESALAGKASTSGRRFFRNVHVVQRTVSPWEVKEND